MVDVLLIFCFILIASLLIIGSITIIYYSQLQACNNNPLPYCYTDWKCLDPNDPTKEINMAQRTMYNKQGVLYRCGLLTAETVDNFTYINNDGVEETVVPSKEINIWSQLCDPKNISECPNYKIGDVYWPACNGSPASNYYVDPKVYRKFKNVR